MDLCFGVSGKALKLWACDLCVYVTEGKQTHVCGNPVRRLQTGQGRESGVDGCCTPSAETSTLGCVSCSISSELLSAQCLKIPPHSRWCFVWRGYISPALATGILSDCCAHLALPCTVCLEWGLAIMFLLESMFSLLSWPHFISTSFFLSHPTLDCSTYEMWNHMLWHLRDPTGVTLTLSGVSSFLCQSFLHTMGWCYISPATEFFSTLNLHLHLLPDWFLSVIRKLLLTLTVHLVVAQRKEIPALTFHLLQFLICSIFCSWATNCE